MQPKGRSERPAIDRAEQSCASELRPVPARSQPCRCRLAPPKLPDPDTTVHQIREVVQTQVQMQMLQMLQMQLQLQLACQWLLPLFMSREAATTD